MGDNLVPKSSESSNAKCSDYVTSKFVVTTIIFLQQKHTMVTKSCWKVAEKYKCLYCDYITCRKGGYSNHRFTAKTYNGDKWWQKVAKSCLNEKRYKYNYKNYINNRSIYDYLFRGAKRPYYTVLLPPPNIFIFLSSSLPPSLPPSLPSPFHLPSISLSPPLLRNPFLSSPCTPHNTSHIQIIWWLKYFYSALFILFWFILF